MAICVHRRDKMRSPPTHSATHPSHPLPSPHTLRTSVAVAAWRAWLGRLPRRAGPLFLRPWAWSVSCTSWVRTCPLGVLWPVRTERLSLTSLPWPYSARVDGGLDSEASGSSCGLLASTAPQPARPVAKRFWTLVGAVCTLRLSPLFLVKLAREN